VLAGAIAAVTGFGIGSLLTPVLALQVDTRLAVAAVSIPHLIGTSLRFALMHGGVDRRVLWSFGITSAAGGLAGALLNSAATNTRWLTILFGVLLLFAAVSEMTGPALLRRPAGAIHDKGLLAAGLAFALPARRGRAAILADIGQVAAGH